MGLNKNQNSGNFNGEVGDMSNYATKSDLSTKVTKEANKSLVDNTLIDKLEDLENYYDSLVREEINSINSQLAQNEKKEVIILPSSNANEEIISELAKGNNVRLVDGEYTINNSIILNDYSKIQGNGVKTVLKWHGLGSCINLTNFAECSNMTIEGVEALSNGQYGYEINHGTNYLNNIYGQNLEIGIYFNATAGGCAYNIVYPRRFIDCKYGVYLKAIQDTWANENMIIGGLFTLLTNTPKEGTWGLYMDSTSQFKVNNNKFIGCAIEQVENGCRIIGETNLFEGLRVELSGARYYFKDTTEWEAKFNIIIGGFVAKLGADDDSTIKHEGADGTLKTYSRNMLFSDDYFQNKVDLDKATPWSNVKLRFENNTIIGNIGTNDVISFSSTNHDFKYKPANCFVLQHGTTAERPNAYFVGCMYFDTDLNKVIVVNNSKKWQDMQGNLV